MGWIIVADSIIIMVMASVAGSLSDRLGSHLLCTVGCAIIFVAQLLLATLDHHASLRRIILPLALWGIGWPLFNRPNQSSLLGAVSPSTIGAAAGMITTARAGGAIGVALCANLFGYLLTAAGLSRAQIEAPESWGAVLEVFMKSFLTTIYALNFFTLAAVVSSTIRGRRPES